MTTEKAICDWCRTRLGKKPFSASAALPVPSAPFVTERPQLSYGLGALVFLIILVVVLSGIYMAMFFQPSPAEAWYSVKFMENSVGHGHFARSLHRWAAFAVLFVTILHIFSTVCRGAYRAPRELNWFSGMLLLLLVSAFIITGYILPWDFRAYWVVKTITNWLEKLPLFSGFLHWLLYTDVPNGAVPVGRWFTLHAVVLPLLTGIILAFHVFLFRRHGSVGTKQ